MRYVKSIVLVFAAITLFAGCFLLFPVPEIRVQGPKTATGPVEDLVSGDTIDFGDVTDGTSLDLTFTITNSGTGELTLSDGPAFVTLVDDPNPGTDFSVPTQPEGTLPRSESTEFVIRFSADGSDFQRDGSLRLESNDEDGSVFELSLTGFSVS